MCSCFFPSWLFKFHKHWMTPWWSHPNHCMFISPFCRALILFITYCAARSHVVACSSLVQGIYPLLVQYTLPTSHPPEMHTLAWGKMLWCQDTMWRASLLVFVVIKDKGLTSVVLKSNHTLESPEALLTDF